MSWRDSTATRATRLVQDVTPRNSTPKRRVTKVDVETHREILRLTNRGLSAARIGPLVGLAASTVFEWQKRAIGWPALRVSVDTSVATEARRAPAYRRSQETVPDGARGSRGSLHGEYAIGQGLSPAERDQVQAQWLRATNARSRVYDGIERRQEPKRWKEQECER